MEIWKDIPGYERYYQASNKGKIKSLQRTITRKSKRCTYPVKERILKQRITKTGYYIVFLYDNTGAKNIKVHRLVALAFILNPEKKPQVNHINGIKTDNWLENLEWCTQKENTVHAVKIGTFSRKGSKHPLSKLNEKNILCIRKLHEKGCSIKSLSKRFKVSLSQINRIVNRKMWTHI